MTKTIIALSACWMLVGACLAQSDQSAPQLVPIEVSLLASINQQRAAYRLAPLVIDWRLENQARRHGNWMANSARMVHSGDGAENIAMGYPSVESVVEGWMHSPGHRANILGNYRSTGVAAYSSSNGAIYWCEQFN